MSCLPMVGGRLPVALLAVAAFLIPAQAFAQQADWPSPIHDDQIFWFLFLEQLEFASTSESDAAVWDVQGWIGGDYNRLWFKSEGDRANRAGAGEFEVQALYSRLIAPYWDFQAGVRYDRQLGTGMNLQRAHLVVGLEGLAPYWWEMEPVLYQRGRGRVRPRDRVVRHAADPALDPAAGSAGFSASVQRRTSRGSKASV